MASRSDSPKGRSLMRIAAAGAVAIGATFAVAGTASAAPASVWDRLAQCESGGNWNTNTGNGFSGGLQFAGSTWRAYGGSGAAHKASRGQQIAVAERVLAKQGWKAWPACSRKLGLR
jgi:resuscitation-promoting factor RpfA